MSGEVLVALIVGVLGFVGTLCGAYFANRKSSALFAYRLEQLEAEVKKHNETLRGRVEELTNSLEYQQSLPDQSAKKIEELEAKCRDIESSFFDIQMENIRLKNENETLKKQRY